MSSVAKVRRRKSDTCNASDALAPKCMAPVGYTSQAALPSPSLEQTTILDAVSEGFNVCVDAVPGSGKTTLALLIAASNSTKRVLILTYNARLKSETREKIKRYGLYNAEAHSFHAFLHRYYASCTNDDDMRQIVRSETKPTRAFRFDIVVIDECQDLDAVKHAMLIKMVFQNNTADDVLQVIVGDKAQCIYQVYGADERYLTYASEAFDVSHREWKKLPLHHSWRLSISVTTFINRVLLGETRLKSCRHVDQKVEYHVMDLLSHEHTGRQVLLDDVLGRYRDGEIMVLFPTVQSRNRYNPVNRISNELTHRRRDVFITKEYDNADEGTVDNKILICNFHRAKGLERKVVIVVGFDASYYEFYNRDVAADDQKQMTNQFYVALTRASERLILLHHYTKAYLPFVNAPEMQSTYMQEHCMCVGDSTPVASDNNKSTMLNVRRVIKCISVASDLWERAKHMLSSAMNVKCFDTTFSLPTTYGDEGVAQVNGVAIPLNARVKATQSIAFMQKYAKGIQGLGEFVRKTGKKTSGESVYEECTKLTEEAVAHGGFENPEHLLKVATVLFCVEDGTKNKYYQVNDFNWLSSKQVESATERYMQCLDELVDSVANVEWERHTECELDDKHTFYGRMDNAIPSDCVIEAKLSHTVGDEQEQETVDPEHLLQLALYMMCEHARGEYPRRGGFLVDLNKGVWNLSLTQGQLDELRDIVLEAVQRAPGERSLAELRQEWKLILGWSGVSSSREKNMCAGYPICLKVKHDVDDDTRRAFALLDAAEKARVYHYFLKGKSEDPVTFRAVDERASVRLDEMYGRFEHVIMNRFIQHEQQDMVQKAMRIDRLRDGEHIVHENCMFVRPKICGGFGRYICPQCNGDLTVGTTTFCNELCGFEAKATLYENTGLYEIPGYRAYVGF